MCVYFGFKIFVDFCDKLSETTFRVVSAVFLAMSKASIFRWFRKSNAASKKMRLV